MMVLDSSGEFGRQCASILPHFSCLPGGREGLRKRAGAEDGAKLTWNRCQQAEKKHISTQNLSHSVHCLSVYMPACLKYLDIPCCMCLHPPLFSLQEFVAFHPGSFFKLLSFHNRLAGLVSETIC